MCDALNYVLLWQFLVGGIDCSYRAVFFLRLQKLHKLAVEGGLSRCHGVLDHGLHLRQNIPLTLWIWIKGQIQEFESVPVQMVG